MNENSSHPELLQTPLAEVWPEEKSHEESPQINVNRRERWASGALGGGLILFGWRTGGLPGFLSALLGIGLLRRGATGHCQLYEKMGVDSLEHRGEEERERSGMKFTGNVTVHRPRGEVYGFWRDFSNLPQVMSHLERVEILSDERSRWVAKPIGGKEIEWEAKIINDRQDELIAWESLPGSSFSNAGTVRFEDAPGNRGTEITLKMQYSIPGGVLTKQLLTILGHSPEEQLKKELRRFKQFMEASELPVNAGNGV